MAKGIPPPKLDEAPLAPGLYVVATPIGNLRDITLRALDVLAAADLVLAEDTRVAGKLLQAYGLSAKLERYDEHARRAHPAQGHGGPGRGQGASRWSPTPARRWSPTPATSWCARRPPRATRSSRSPAPRRCWPALSAAGLPTDRFLFAGFPPPKSAARRTFLEELGPDPRHPGLLRGRLAAGREPCRHGRRAGRRARGGGLPRTDQALRDRRSRPARRPRRRSQAATRPRARSSSWSGPGREAERHRRRRRHRARRRPARACAPPTPPPRSPRRSGLQRRDALPARHGSLRARK